LAHRTTPANGDERAQVMPLLDAVKLRTGTRGRPRKRLKVIATDKGYDAKALRQKLRQRGIRAQIPKRVWKTKKNRGRPINKVVPASKRAHLRLAPEKVSPSGRPVGASCRMFRRVSGNGDHSYVDSAINSGIDS